jgi:hypothetical protein
MEESRRTDAEVDAEIEAERFAAVDHFNRVYSRFLRAKARYMAPPPKRVGEEGDAYEAYMETGSSNYFARVTEMIAADAILKYQIAHKFEILYELLRDNDTERALKLSQSIQDNIGNLEEGWPLKRAG